MGSGGLKDKLLRMKVEEKEQLNYLIKGWQIQMALFIKGTEARQPETQEEPFLSNSEKTEIRRTSQTLPSTSFHV